MNLEFGFKLGSWFRLGMARDRVSFNVRVRIGVSLSVRVWVRVMV